MDKWFEGVVIAIGDGLIVARKDNGGIESFAIADGEGGEDLKIGDHMTVWLVQDAEVN